MSLKTGDLVRLAPPRPSGPPCAVCGGRGFIPDRSLGKLNRCPYCKGAGDNAWRAQVAQRDLDIKLLRKLFRAAHWVAIVVVLAIVVRSPTGVPPVWEMFVWFGLVLLKPILWVIRTEDQARRDRGYRT